MAIQPSGARSAELSFRCGTHVPADQLIRCLRDQMIVEPIGVDHGGMLAVIEHTKPLRGIVKAIGPGHYPKRYDHPDKHRRTKYWDGMRFVPTEVKVGDIVQLGSPQGERGYTFQSLYWGEKLHLICREADVVGVEHGMA